MIVLNGGGYVLPRPGEASGSGAGVGAASTLSHSSSSAFSAPGGIAAAATPTALALPSAPVAPRASTGISIVVKDLTGGMHELTCASSESIGALKRRLEVHDTTPGRAHACERACGDVDVDVDFDVDVEMWIRMWVWVWV